VEGPLEKEQEDKIGNGLHKTHVAELITTKLGFGAGYDSDANMDDRRAIWKARHNLQTLARAQSLNFPSL